MRSSFPYSPKSRLIIRFFFSTFRAGKLTTPRWKMPTLRAFIESLTREHDNLVQMGIIRSSRDQALHVLSPKDLKDKGNHQKNPKTKFEDPKPKVENQQHEDPFVSKKNKRKGNHAKENLKYSY